MKNYCIDIDGTICSNTDGEYENAKPYIKRIEEIFDYKYYLARD